MEGDRMKLGWKKCVDCETYFDWAFFNSHGCPHADEFDFWGNVNPVLCDLCYDDRRDEEE